MKTTTEKIRELAASSYLPFSHAGSHAIGRCSYDAIDVKHPNGEWEIIFVDERGDIQRDYIIEACNNAARMARLLELAEAIISTGGPTKSHRDVWLDKFSEFQRGEHG